MKYFIVAGERSGDVHASRLVREIKKRDVRAEFIGLGGKFMEKEGVQLIAEYHSLAWMGFFEVILHLHKILRILKMLKRAMLQASPDVLILVDFPGFNLKLAAFAKKNRIKTCYYISPKIWAWKSGRIRQIRRDIDKMLVILPFEKEVYAQKGYEVEYVGNPVMDTIRTYDFDTNFSLEKLGPNIAVLPGSRKQEILASVKVISLLAQLAPQYRFIIAAVDNIPTYLYDAYKEIENVEVHFEKTYEILKVCNAAIVTSGTATLEAALLNCPQVVVYKANYFTVLIVRFLLKVRYISLVNLIANKQVVKELIQADYHPKAVKNELDLLLNNPGYCAKMLLNYQKIREVIQVNSASKNAGKIIVEWLESSDL